LSHDVSRENVLSMVGAGQGISLLHECGTGATYPPSNFGRPQDALGSRSAQQACRFNSRYLDIGPRRPACDASQGNLLIRPQWLRLRAASPSPVRDQTRHTSLMRRARSSGRFRRSRDAK